MPSTRVRAPYSRCGSSAYRSELRGTGTPRGRARVARRHAATGQSLRRESSSRRARRRRDAAGTYRNRQRGRRRTDNRIDGRIRQITFQGSRTRVAVDVGARSRFHGRDLAACQRTAGAWRSGELALASRAQFRFSRRGRSAMTQAAKAWRRLRRAEDCRFPGMSAGARSRAAGRCSSSSFSTPCRSPICSPEFRGRLGLQPRRLRAHSRRQPTAVCWSGIRCASALITTALTLVVGYPAAFGLAVLERRAAQPVPCVAVSAAGGERHRQGVRLDDPAALAWGGQRGADVSASHERSRSG